MPLIETNPIHAAREAMIRLDYDRARKILLAEYDRDTNRFEMARIINLIDLGMIPEALDALNRWTGSIEEYQQNPPANEDIGGTVKLAALATA